MVIAVKIAVNQLAALGKEFPWPKPSCPFCGERLWGHGFVPAYLACLTEAVLLRRLYCPHCGSVHRLRPESHWRRFQSSSKTIEDTICHRWRHGRWRPDLPRARQRQWWYRLRRKAVICLGLAGGELLVDAFLMLLQAGAIPVSSVIKCGNEAG